jgi:uncharacterized protein (DUF433 family)
MVEFDPTVTVPLTQWDDGSIRVTGSRLPIDSILYHFKRGSVPEQLIYMFPGLRLVDVYSVITYYLGHREAVDEYLRNRKAAEDAVLQRLEADPDYQREKREFHERLMARWTALQREKASSTRK